MSETSRAVAQKILLDVLKNGRSLNTIDLAQPGLDTRDRAFAMELVYGVLRWRWRLEFYLQCLMKKPLRGKDIDIQVLLLLGLYDLGQMSTPDYAAVNELVKLVTKTKKKWASGLINAVLRAFAKQRERLSEQLHESDTGLYSHPQWLLESIKHDWPEYWQNILNANNRRPPMWLRVNQRQYSTDDYVQLLKQNDIEAEKNDNISEALRLKTPTDVSQLPDFDKGAVSVQDVGAQLAAVYLDAQPGDRVLDCCSAPGGKACHILERQPELAQMTLVELDETRMQRVKQNLDRLALQGQCIIGDAGDPESWWDGKPYDRILLDVPCSASGVIRRHPDIKTLRQFADLDDLVQIQRRILDSSWRLLAPGGCLLYVTCSVLKCENVLQIGRFMADHPDASEQTIDSGPGIALEHGVQMLPHEVEHNFDCDGYYYVCLRRAAA